MHWLTGWLLIVLHFFGFMFAPVPGVVGIAGTLFGVLTLVWAGVLFMRASVPYWKEISSQVMFWVLIGIYTLYVSSLMLGASPWILTTSAALLGAAPLAVALAFLPHFRHPLRWVIVVLQLCLGVFILIVQRGGNGGGLALNAVLFTVYIGTAIHFWHMYRRASAGAIISISGFILWANVFTVGPVLLAWFPNIHMESEVWNLPKYVVAVGMILVLLEDQIAHNKHLALHDALTGLPNRRLFEDRLAIALERARRTGTQTALLMLDLDQFKQVNDTLGHHGGDLLLQKVAELFRGRVRRSDTVARTGGDEFAIVLEAPTSPEEAEHVGRSLLELLTAPIELEQNMVRVGASIGVAIFPNDAEELEALCIKADLRMYEAKRGHLSGATRGGAPEIFRSYAGQPAGSG
jgi:diguanylate cyclase (GGDEF)-like protein